MPASNTRDCFTEFVGQRLIGVMFGVFPLHYTDLSRGTKTLIFEDGRGLTIGNNGSLWVDSATEVKRAVDRRVAELERGKAEIAEVVRLAGALPAEAVEAS